MTKPELPTDQRSPAGSPDQGEPVFLAVGRVRKPHGLHGEVSLQVLTDFPERLEPGTTVYLGDDRRPVTIQAIRGQGKHTLVTFAGISSRDAAGSLRNLWVAVLSDDRPALPEGDYYHHEMIGLQVQERGGQPLGIVQDILVTGANDVYVVRPEDGGEILIPALDSVILEVNLPEKRMIVALPPGLI